MNPSEYIQNKLNKVVKDIYLLKENLHMIGYSIKFPSSFLYRMGGFERVGGFAGYCVCIVSIVCMQLHVSACECM